MLGLGREIGHGLGSGNKGGEGMDVGNGLGLVLGDQFGTMGRLY